MSLGTSSSLYGTGRVFPFSGAQTRRLVFDDTELNQVDPIWV